MRQAAIALLLAWPASAVARVLVPADVDGAAARQVALAARRCGAAVELRAGAERQEPAAAATVVEAVAAARAATLEAEFDRAIADLARLYGTLRDRPELAGTGRIWAEALAVEAFARWSRAGGPDAIPEDVALRLDHAVSLWPEVAIDRDVMPPAMDRALEAARRRRADLPFGELRIEDPRIAPAAWVSGIREAARRVMRPAGELLVASVDAAGEVRARVVRVRPRASSTVALATGGPSAEALRSGGAIAVWASAEGLRALAWEDGGARSARGATAEQIVDRLELCAGGPSPPAGTGGVSSGTPTWIWVAVGGAVLAAGGTVLALALTAEPEAELRFRLQR